MDLKIVSFLALAALASPSDQQAQDFCGRKLANTLALLCENGLLLEKKSDLPFQDYGVSFQWPSVERHQAQAMGAHSRGKRHVVDECCLQPCTIDELMSYCA